jgi:hypothetical protein
MREFIAVITAVLVMISCLLTGCTLIKGSTGNAAPRLDLSSFEFSHRIMCRHIHTSPFLLLFSGTTDLPDGTVIQSQLYENGILVTWWPSDREYVVEDGEWEIKVLTNEIVAYENLIPSSSYWLIILVKDDPSIIDGTYWDTIGPPVP